jgi:hypothetical protein
VEALMPKKNYNPRSRDNLRQYQLATTKKAKEDIARGILEDVPIDENLLGIIIAHKEICKNKKEEERFLDYIKEYLKEYSKKGTELTISDMDDIATLCMNNILITRMLKADNVAEVMAPVERLKKDNIKLKENLASTRKDRVDPRAGEQITVSDLLLEYEKEQSVRRKKLEQYRIEEEAIKDQCHTSVEDLIT